VRLSKASLYFWIAVILAIQQSAWVSVILNEPGSIYSHDGWEWLAIACLTYLFALGQGLVALRALGSNPNGNGKTNEKTNDPVQPPASGSPGV
jgi:hypothetical protein